MKTSAKALALLTAIASLSATSLAGSVVKVVGKPGAWHLTVNGKPFFFRKSEFFVISYDSFSFENMKVKI